MIPQVLESYDIPYEMFSLDSGDYKKTFDLDMVLPRDSSDELFISDSSEEVIQQVKKYFE